MEAAAEQRRLEQQAADERKKRDEQARLEAEEQAKRDAEAAAARAKNSEPRQKLDGYLNSIANSGNVNAANNSINEALTLFASPQTPVLIVISEENGQKDYDRPTTIIDYLNYLKDQKKNMNKISNVQYDAAGKITELELTKQ
jgi:ATPase subunit of ABC transporter with duplicated ATPase domains